MSNLNSELTGIFVSWYFNFFCPFNLMQKWIVD